MKKLILLFCLFCVCQNSLMAQYSKASLNGPWFAHVAPLNPFNDSLLYLVFDGNGGFTAIGGFGEYTGSKYDVTSNGIISGIFVDRIIDTLTFTGQLTSDKTGSLNVDGMIYLLSKIPNPGALNGTLTGTLSTVNCGEKSVTVQIDNQGLVTSANGLTGPVNGRVYTDMGVLQGHLYTGDSNAWHELSIWGYFSNNQLIGRTGIESSSCDEGIAVLTFVGSNGLAPVLGSDSEMSLFPNPAAHQINIRSKVANDIDWSCFIYNSFGEVVISSMINQSQNQINVSDLSNGIYFIQLQTEEKKVIKKLFIQK